MAKGTNQEATLCYGCSEELDVGQGIGQRFFDDRFLCAACNEKEEEKARLKRAKETREASVLLGILQGLPKGTSVINIQGGVGEWRQQLTIEQTGHSFTISVSEVEKQDD